MDLGLAGKACIVTGASKGIGLEVARRLVAEGARVLLVGRDAEAVAAVGVELQCPFIPADVTVPEDPARILAACEYAFGGVDVLVNNAGTSQVIPLAELPDAEWERQYALNVLGPKRLIEAVRPSMAARGGGAIVNVSSSAGKRPSSFNGAYSVTKAAQLGLSRLYAEAYAGDRIRVNAVAPGATSSPLWIGPGGMADQIAEQEGKARDEVLAERGSGTPLGRFIEPGEVADAVVLLCSERTSAVTGAAWSVDGGVVRIII